MFSCITWCYRSETGKGNTKIFKCYIKTTDASYAINLLLTYLDKHWRMGKSPLVLSCQVIDVMPDDARNYPNIYK